MAAVARLITCLALPAHAFAPSTRSRGGVRVASSLERNPDFPTADTLPADVVRAQLAALAARDLPAVYALFSRARRSVLEQTGRAQSSRPPAATLFSLLNASLEATCPGLLGHSHAEITAALTLHIESEARGAGRRLPRWRCRVRLTPDARALDDDALRLPTHYTFTLTRQHDPPPPPEEALRAPDVRNLARFDGFEGCWFVWSIQPDGNGGSDGDDAETPSGGKGSARVLVPTG